jgi:hypothetical protein
MTGPGPLGTRSLQIPNSAFPSYQNPKSSESEKRKSSKSVESEKMGKNLQPSQSHKTYFIATHNKL